MIPSVGRIVHYRLAEHDLSLINGPQQPGLSRNSHSVGQVIPFLICNTWSDSPTEDAAVNGQGFVDGNFSIWLTSRHQGTEPGQWSDPRA